MAGFVDSVIIGTLVYLLRMAWFAYTAHALRAGHLEDLQIFVRTAEGGIVTPEQLRFWYDSIQRAVL